MVNKFRLVASRRLSLQCLLPLNLEVRATWLLLSCSAAQLPGPDDRDATETVSTHPGETYVARWGRRRGCEVGVSTAHWQCGGIKSYVPHFALSLSVRVCVCVACNLFAYVTLVLRCHLSLEWEACVGGAWQLDIVHLCRGKRQFRFPWCIIKGPQSQGFACEYDTSYLSRCEYRVVCRYCTTYILVYIYKESYIKIFMLFTALQFESECKWSAGGKFT